MFWGGGSSTLGVPDADLYLSFSFPFREINTLACKITPVIGCAPSPGAAFRSEETMQDLTMLFYTCIFFGVAFLYVKACQKLR